MHKKPFKKPTLNNRFFRVETNLKIRQLTQKYSLFKGRE